MMLTINYSKFISSLPFSLEAFLFDLDGVLLDSERVYQMYWEKVAIEFGKDPHVFPFVIQGVNIDDNVEVNFPEAERARIKQGFVDLQLSMQYVFYEGIFELLTYCREKRIKTAIVTSSDKEKMEVVYEQHPILKELIDVLVTAEDVHRRKPAPDCWLKAAFCLGVDIHHCVIFEDSTIGLRSALDSGGYVVGLTTTHRSEEVRPLCNYMINRLSHLA